MIRFDKTKNTASSHNRSRQEGGLRTRDAFHKQHSPENPLITVITVVRNGEKTLEQTIQSVLSQPYENVEYIVIDGGSTDGTIDIIKKYEDRIAFWVSEPDAGIYDAMNKGIQYATGELINLLNADDYLEPGALQLVGERYSAYRKPCIVFGNAYYVDEKYGVKASFYSTLSPWLGMTVNHQTMFVSRGIYDKIGLYDIQYQLAADYDFFVRCCRSHVDFIKLDEVIVNCRNAGATVVHSKKSSSEVDAISKKYYGLFSTRRFSFIIFDKIWTPFKLSVRAFMYRTVGVKITRTVIAYFRKTHFSRHAVKNPISQQSK